ncbi:MAG TPA: hypothetical protein VFN99_10045 [Gaiella sp.]|nr:hypothetical protein [Gaiella sp.]
MVVPPPERRASLTRAVALLTTAAALTAGDALAATPAGPPLSPAPVAAPAEPRLIEGAAIKRFLAEPKVAGWLERYPADPTTDASFDRRLRSWTVHVWSGDAGEIAQGMVQDADGRVTRAWTGPQVAWQMARGRPGAFGGKLLTSWPVWLGLSTIFFIGLASVRRPLSVHNLDLLVLLSFGVSLAFFNRGEVFRSAALAVPPLAYLLLRAAWIGFRRGRATPSLPSWPVWLLAAATLFLVGFRVGLNVDQPRTVIDVGYAGVIGADRILDGRAPYGAMPVDGGRACGPPRADGRIRERIQANGRCESTNPRGDTYGPVAYLAYVPAVLTLGWSGRWDALPAAHATAIAADLLTLAGLVLIGLQLAGARLAAVLAFGWAAYPFTAYALMSNTNDALMPAFLVWGFWLASSPAARGAAVAFAGWTKFAALLVVPLWLTYRSGLRIGSAARFTAAFAIVTALAFTVLLLEPSLGDALRTFWDRTLGYQLGRESPFSIWGWGQYHARGIPDLGSVQTLVQVGAIALAGVASAVPRDKGPLELAALTAAVLLAVQLSLTHWFYLYLPWVLPFVLLALVAPRTRPAEA